VENLCVGADLFMGQMEEQTEGQRNMMKLKATYRNFSKTPVREQYHLCHGVGACLPCIFRHTSNFKPRRKMM
jgi:hypothetical protein